MRATHDFLCEREILEIKQYVPEAFRRVPSLSAAIDEVGAVVGFIGTSENRIEMLFIAPEMRGKGIGRQLLQQAVAGGSINEVTVNEQNPQAAGFYRHLGFQVFERTETDEQGNPFPILKMELKNL